MTVTVPGYRQPPKNPGTVYPLSRGGISKKRMAEIVRIPDVMPRFGGGQASTFAPRPYTPPSRPATRKPGPLTLPASGGGPSWMEGGFGRAFRDYGRATGRATPRTVSQRPIRVMRPGVQPDGSVYTPYTPYKPRRTGNLGGDVVMPRPGTVPYVPGGAPGNTPRPGSPPLSLPRIITPPLSGPPTSAPASPPPQRTNFTGSALADMLSRPRGGVSVYDPEGGGGLSSPVEWMRSRATQSPAAQQQPIKPNDWGGNRAYKAIKTYEQWRDRIAALKEKNPSMQVSIPFNVQREYEQAMKRFGTVSSLRQNTLGEGWTPVGESNLSNIGGMLNSNTLLNLLEPTRPRRLTEAAGAGYRKLPVRTGPQGQVIPGGGYEVKTTTGRKIALNRRAGGKGYISKGGVLYGSPEEAALNYIGEPRWPDMISPFDSSKRRTLWLPSGIIPEQVKSAFGEDADYIVGFLPGVYIVNKGNEFSFVYRPIPGQDDWRRVDIPKESWDSPLSVLRSDLSRALRGRVSPKEAASLRDQFSEVISDFVTYGLPRSRLKDNPYLSDLSQAYFIQERPQTPNYPPTTPYGGPQTPNYPPTTPYGGVGGVPGGGITAPPLPPPAGGGNGQQAGGQPVVDNPAILSVLGTQSPVYKPWQTQMAVNLARAKYQQRADPYALRSALARPAGISFNSAMLDSLVAPQRGQALAQAALVGPQIIFGDADTNRQALNQAERLRLMDILGQGGVQAALQQAQTGQLSALLGLLSQFA